MMRNIKYHLALTDNEYNESIWKKVRKALP